MNSMCEQLSDRMPAVARGADCWTPDELAHLDRCADCRDEWRLVRASHALGLQGTMPMDVARLTAAVTAGRQPGTSLRPRRIRFGWQAGGLAAAALASLLIWSGVQRSGTPMEHAGTAPALSLRLPALDSLSEEELQTVLDDFGAAAPSLGNEIGAPGLGDLDSTELQRVLDAWEG